MFLRNRLAPVIGLVTVVMLTLSGCAGSRLGKTEATPSPTSSASVSISPSATPTPSATETPADTLTQEEIQALTQSAQVTDYCTPWVKSFTFQGQVYQVLVVNDPSKVEKEYGTSVFHALKSSDATGVADEMVEAVCLYSYYGGHLASGLSLLKFVNADIVGLNPVLAPWTLDHSDTDRAQRAASFNPDLSGVKFDANGMVADAASADLVKAWLAKRAEWQKEANQILDLFFKFQANGVSERMSIKNFWQLPAQIPTVGLAPHQENLPAQEFVLTDKDARCPAARFAINRKDMRFELLQTCPAPTPTMTPSSGGSSGGGGGGHHGCPSGTYWDNNVRKCVSLKNVKDYPDPTVKATTPAPKVSESSPPAASAPPTYTAAPQPSTSSTPRESPPPPNEGGTPTTRAEG